MRKRILAMASVLMLMLTIPAYAVQSRAPAVLPSLSFSGTTANCGVLATADNYTDDIYLEIELWRGSVKIEDWTASGEGFVDFRETASVVKVSQNRVASVGKCDLHMQVTRGYPRVITFGEVLSKGCRWIYSICLDD